MKRVFVIGAFLVGSYITSELRAQATDDDIQIVQGAWGKQKRELVSAAMQLSDKDSVKFWPVYERYEIARKKLGKDRIKVLDEYATNFEKLTSVQTDDIVARLFKNEAGFNALLQQYYAEVKKSLNSMQAAKFLHIESFLQSYIKVHIQANIPYIGSLEKAKTN